MQQQYQQKNNTTESTFVGVFICTLHPFFFRWLFLIRVCESDSVFLFIFAFSVFRIYLFNVTEWVSVYWVCVCVLCSVYCVYGVRLPFNRRFFLTLSISTFFPVIVYSLMLLKNQNICSAPDCRMPILLVLFKMVFIFSPSIFIVFSLNSNLKPYHSLFFIYTVVLLLPKKRKSILVHRYTF